MKKYNFYSVIIGTELLNGRRIDAHFKFLNDELLKRDWNHAGSFVIEDKPPLIKRVYNTIKEDKDSVMFSFGGIGATPDDYTREVAAKVFRDGKMEMHKEAKAIIEDKFGDRAYPNRIKMANIPINSKLLENPITKVPGFYLDDRFFFVPGFPEMARPMIKFALDTYYNGGAKKFRKSVHINTTEENLISFMHTLPDYIELSSLPLSGESGPEVTISLASYEEDEVECWFDKLIALIKTKEWEYILEDKRR